MREETLAILRETRATCIVVTHDAEEAMRIVEATDGGEHPHEPARAVARHTARLRLQELYATLAPVERFFVASGAARDVGPDAVGVNRQVGSRCEPLGFAEERFGVVFFLPQSSHATPRGQQVRKLIEA